MSQSSVTSQSTWRSKIKAMGPGILMASAAVGGSHIVSSTQAGGMYGWALLGLVILANLFKYPFFRFVRNTQQILEKLWLKDMLKKGSSTFGYSSSSMFSQLWLIQQVLQSSVRLSLRVPFPC